MNKVELAKPVIICLYGFPGAGKSYVSRNLASVLQLAQDSAFFRAQNRDRRTNDDKYSLPASQEFFQSQLNGMQNPQGEDYLVISGKHTFTTQKSAVINRLYQMGVLGSEYVQSSVAKPELVNLIPNPRTGRVDFSRRNITIR
jgi:ABC-type glutathione transport system ATPase component